MLFTSFVFTLLATTLAQPLEEHQHQHQHEKRAVKVVTAVNTVTVTAGYGAAQAATASSVTLEAATDAVANTFSYVPQQQPSSFSNPTTFATVATSTSSTSAPQSTETSSGNFDGGAKGITYSPYSDDGGCKSSSEIASDIAKLSAFEIIRIYGVDCNQAEAVLSSIGSNQKVFAGIFDVANIQSGIETLASAVNNNGGWGKIHTVSIGNELVNAGSASPSQIKNYMSTARSALSSAGYTGPVVSVDTFIAVINNPELCDYSDYMAVNAHAFFDGHYTADQAGEWVLQQIQRVYTACGGSKSVFITETGWPSQGSANGAAVPSSDNQKAAVASIKKVCGDAVTLFTAFNDYWKAPGSFGCEQYWGIF